VKNLKNIKLTNTHKIIIGVVGLGVLAFLIRKYWMPKKKQEEISKQSIPNKILIPTLTKSSNIVGGNVNQKQNLDRIYCHNPRCNWSWKVKDGGDDLYVCHKCFTDNEKFYVNTAKKN
jgi:hypothetical protein